MLPTAPLVSVSAALLERTKANQTYLLFLMLSLKRPKTLPLDSLKPRIPAAREFGWARQGPLSYAADSYFPSQQGSHLPDREAVNSPWRGSRRASHARVRSPVCAATRATLRRSAGSACCDHGCSRTARDLTVGNGVGEGPAYTSSKAVPALLAPQTRVGEKEPESRPGRLGLKLPPPPVRPPAELRPSLQKQTPESHRQGRGRSWAPAPKSCPTPGSEGTRYLGNHHISGRWGSVPEAPVTR